MKNRQHCEGLLKLEYYSKSKPTLENKVIHFRSLKQLLYEFEKWYSECHPITYKILRYCADWSYYREGSTQWFIQQRNVAEQSSDVTGYEVNPEYILGLYLLLEQHLFDKGLK